MPIYRIACDECGAQQDLFRSVAQYDDLPDCCGVRMHRVMCAPAVVADYQPYRSMVTGEMIEGRKAHKEHLKRHNVVEVGNDLDKASPKPQRWGSGQRCQPRL